MFLVMISFVPEHSSAVTFRVLVSLTRHTFCGVLNEVLAFPPPLPVLV